MRSIWVEFITSSLHTKIARSVVMTDGAVTGLTLTVSSRPEAPRRGTPRNRSAALLPAGHEVARPQIAAVRGVMRHELRHGPVHLPEVPAADAHRRRHLLRLQPHLERDVVAVAAGQVRHRRGIAGRPLVRRDAERLERVERHDPRRDRRPEALGQEWSERLVLPSLDVARGPVIDQTE